MFPNSVTTSGNFNFAPSLGEIVLNAFSRIQVRPSEITQAHMFQARMAANDLLSEWSNLTPNLWEVDLQQIALVQGTATYTVAPETVMILDLCITYGLPATDRYIFPMSRTEYASFPNKTQQAFPNQFWYDRLVAQTVTFFPVPDGNGPYTAKFYRVRQTQDADLPNGLNVEIPYRFYSAYISGMAWKLSEHYAPQLEDKMFGRYTRALGIATTQDTENVPLFIAPQTGGYFRN